MKSATLVSILVLGLCASGQAAMYTNTFSGTAGNIPDNNLSGWSDTITVNDSSLQPIAQVRVTVNITGGFNGDLYGYLRFDNGVDPAVLVPLVNRVGVTAGNAFGYSDAGMNVTFADSAVNNIHFYRDVVGPGVPTGIWQPDGRAINPLSAPSAFDAATPTTFADAFNGLNQTNATWTLFFADVSGGGGQSQVVSWTLEIDAVAEPINIALGIFAGVFLIGTLCRTERVRKLFNKAATTETK